MAKNFTTGDLLGYWLNQLHNHVVVAKVAIDDCEKAEQQILQLVSKMNNEKSQVINALIQTIEKTSKCPHCGKSTSTKITKPKKKNVISK